MAIYNQHRDAKLTIQSFELNRIQELGGDPMGTPVMGMDIGHSSGTTGYISAENAFAKPKRNVGDMLYRHIVATEEERKSITEHPVHRILLESNVKMINTLDEKEAARMSAQMISVMAYIDTLEENIQGMKGDVINILHKYPQKVTGTPGANAPGTSLVRTVLASIEEEINNL